MLVKHMIHNLMKCDSDKTIFIESCALCGCVGEPSQFVERENDVVICRSDYGKRYNNIYETSFIDLKFTNLPSPLPEKE